MYKGAASNGRGARWHNVIRHCQVLYVMPASPRSRRAVWARSSALER